VFALSSRKDAPPQRWAGSSPKSGFDIESYRIGGFRALPKRDDGLQREPA